MRDAPRFGDRGEAGRRLAAELEDLRDARPVVLGIPRGGMVIASEIASSLDALLDVVVVRKLGYPGREEAAFGAVGEGGVVVPESLAHVEPGERGFDALQQALEAKHAEVQERITLYRGGRERVPLEGCTAIVVDDGIATGYTFAAALAVARSQEPARLVAAAPVASQEGAELVSSGCDELRSLFIAERGHFFAVSLYYDHFPQVSDEQVVEVLSRGPGGSGLLT